MIKSLLVASVACAHLLTPVADQPDGIETTSVGTWQMACAVAERDCELVKTMVSPDDPNAFLRVAFLRRDEGYLMIVRTPPLKEPALSLTLDTGDSALLQSPTCGAEGCRFLVSMDFDQSHKFKDASTAMFAMEMQTGGLVNVSVDVGDLWTAFDAHPRDL